MAIYFGWFAIIFIIAFIGFGILLPGSINMRILSLLIVLIALSAWCIFGYSSYYNFDKSSSLEIQNDLLYDIELLSKSEDTQTSVITVTKVSLGHDNKSFGRHYLPQKDYIVCSTDSGEDYYFLISKNDEEFIRKISDNPPFKITYFTESGFIKEIN